MVYIVDTVDIVDHVSIVGNDVATDIVGIVDIVYDVDDVDINY